MQVRGMPEHFWVVTRATETSELADICFASTFDQLLLQGRGGLHEYDIIGIFADEAEAKEKARTLIGANVVRPEDVLAVEVLVRMMVVPTIRRELTAKILAQAAVDAVENAVRHAEEEGYEHELVGEVSLGAGTVDLHNHCIVFG